MKLMYCAVLVLGIGLLPAGASADEPKTYKISVASQSKIGGSELQPGEYKLVVDAPKVQFLKGKDAVDVNAKVETADAKFEHTAITTKVVDGVRQIVEIRIGGSKTRLMFESN